MKELIELRDKFLIESTAPDHSAEYRAGMKQASDMTNNTIRRLLANEVK